MASLFDDVLYIVKGVPLSLGITLAALVIGFILAIVCTCVLTLFHKKWPAYLARTFVTFFTGTPLLVQILLIYSGPGQFEWLRESWLWPILSQAWFCAILALALNSAAYTTQLFHGAVLNIPEGQWQACAALGMGCFETLKVLLPLALRRALPSYSNEIVLVFKSTALVSTITLLDIMGRTSEIVGRTYDYMTFYAIAGGIYIVINGGLILVAKSIERWALRFDHAL